MVHELCRKKPRYVINFVEKHPELLPLVRKLAFSENEWFVLKELKKEAGLATRASGADFGKCQSLINRCLDCNLIETSYDKSHRSLVRVLPGKNEEMLKIVCGVEE